MSFIPASLTRTIARQVLVAQKHSPHLLFGAGVVGMVATVVSASQATLKLSEVLDETNKNLDRADMLLQHDTKEGGEYTEEKYKHDVRVLRAAAAHQIIKLYGPSVVLGVASIACLTKSHQIMTRRNAAITAAYAALEKTLDGYRQRVREELGEEKEKELRFGALRKQAELEKAEQEADSERPKKDQLKRKDGGDLSRYAKHFGPGNPNWQRFPEANLMYLRQQQNWMNDKLMARGHVFLNEVYDILGLERTRAGSVVGWLRDGGDGYIDFGIWEDRNLNKFHAFAGGENDLPIILDFNVDGSIWDRI
jgi:hypothetical protein